MRAPFAFIRLTVRHRFGLLAAMRPIAASLRLSPRGRPGDNLPARLSPCWALLGALLAAGATASSALAHSGAPYRVIAPAPAGPFTVSVWADPDVGAGTIYVLVEPASSAGGGAHEVSIAVRPMDGHLAEAVYPTRLEPAGGTADRFIATVPFDTEGQWAMRVLLQGPEGRGEAATSLQVTPAEGPQRWETWLYIFPFALLAFVWLWRVWVARGERAGDPDL